MENIHKQIPASFFTRDGVIHYNQVCERQDQTYRNFLLSQVQCYLPQNKKILELGSGSGQDIKLFLPHYQITASDISSAFLALLKKKYPTINQLQLDAITSSTQPFKFDAIYSNKVLIYISYEQLIAALRLHNSWLTKGGWIFHSFWRAPSLKQMDFHQKKQVYEALQSRPKIKQHQQSLEHNHQQNSDGESSYYMDSEIQTVIDEHLHFMYSLEQIVVYSEEETNDSLLLIAKKR